MCVVNTSLCLVTHYDGLCSVYVMRALFCQGMSDDDGCVCVCVVIFINAAATTASDCLLRL